MQFKLRIVRISLKEGVQFLADWDGEEYLWSNEETDCLHFMDVEKAHTAAYGIPGHVRLEGWVGDRWAVDYNRTLDNRHRA